MNKTEHRLLVLLNKHWGLKNIISSFADSTEILLGLLKKYSHIEGYILALELDQDKKTEKKMYVLLCCQERKNQRKDTMIFWGSHQKVKEIEDKNQDLLFHLWDDRINGAPRSIQGHGRIYHNYVDVRNADVNGSVLITGKENLSKIMQQVQKHLLADTRKDSRRSNNRKK